MVELVKELEDVQAPGKRPMKEIINDVNNKGVCEGQISELLDTMEYLVHRLVYSDSERFSK